MGLPSSLVPPGSFVPLHLVERLGPARLVILAVGDEHGDGSAVGGVSHCGVAAPVGMPSGGGQPAGDGFVKGCAPLGKLVLREKAVEGGHHVVAIGERRVFRYVPLETVG